MKPKDTSTSVPIFFSWFAILITIAIVVLQPTLDQLLGSSLVSLHFAFIIVSAAFISSIVSKKQPNMILFMVWNFNYCVFGISAFYQLQAGLPPWPVLVNENSYFVALFAALSMSIILTFLVATSPNRISTVGARSINSRRLHILAFLLLPFVFFVVDKVSGDIGYFFTTRTTISNVTSLNRVERGLYLIVCQSLTLLITTLSIREYRFGKRTNFTTLGLMFGTFGIVVLCNPLSSSRYWVLTCLTTLALSSINLTAFRLRVFAALVMFGTFVLFPLANYFRSTDRKYATGKSALLSGDFDALQLSAISVDWLGANGSAWGEQLLGAALFWVPRFYWETKPIDTGEKLAIWSGLKFTNLSGPWVAEALVNFGLLGVIILPVLIYWVIRRQLAGTPNDDFGIVSYAFLVGYTPILLRGSLIQAMGYVASFLGLLWFSTRRTTASKLNTPPLD